MGTITEVSAQQKNAKRVNVYVDGEFAAALEALTAVEYGLKAGREIDGAELEAIVLRSDGETAFRRATDYLGRRSRTVSEIETYLRGKGYAETVIESTLHKLKEYGYLDDAEFVRTYMETYADRRGKKRLRQDLLRLGVSTELVEEALGGMDGQSEAAVNAAKKYLRSHPLDSRKLSAHLASKGFEWEDVRTALRLVGGKEEDE